MALETFKPLTTEEKEKAKSRIISDAELVKGGAEIRDDGSLEVTKEQIQEAKEEMEKDKIAKIQQDIQGIETSETPVQKKETKEQRIESLSSIFKSLRSWIQMMDCAKPDLTNDLEAIKNKLKKITAKAEEANDLISPETKIFLTELETLTKCLISLGEENPIIKTGKLRSLLGGSELYKRLGLEEVKHYIFEFIKDAEIE